MPNSRKEKGPIVKRAGRPHVEYDKVQEDEEQVDGNAAHELQLAHHRLGVLQLQREVLALLRIPTLPCH